LFTGRLQHPTKRIDGLTSFLLNEAEAGDVVALQIVLEHGRELGDYAVVAARFVGLEGTPFSLVLAGGVLRHPSMLLADKIIERVKLFSPEVHPKRSRFEPIIGVLFSALEDANVTIDEKLLNRLIPTLPSSELYATVMDYTLR
jgi:hypothetical protein